MSAPDTNIDKQEARHKPALMGIRGVVVFAAVLFLGFLGWVAWSGQTPDDAAVKVDGRTGDTVVVD